MTLNEYSVGALKEICACFFVFSIHPSHSTPRHWTPPLPSFLYLSRAWRSEPVPSSHRRTAHGGNTHSQLGLCILKWYFTQKYGVIFSPSSHSDLSFYSNTTKMMSEFYRALWSLTVRMTSLYRKVAAWTLCLKVHIGFDFGWTIPLILEIHV